MRSLLDPQNMEEIIQRSPAQFAAGVHAAAGPALPAWDLSAVLVAGMGGSWMAAALLEALQLSTVPIHIHRSYELPGRLPAGTRTLVIASSFSGNTEETLSAYEAARAAGLPLAGVAAGGELEKRCGRDGVPFVRIPADPPTMQPRNATGYTVGILTRLLARAGLATTETVTAVERLGDYLTAFMKTARERGEALVPKLTDVTPVIYAADRFATVAQIWKIKLNENAKTPAFWNVFPELNHNEMIGWSKTPRSRREGRTTPPGTFHLVFLQAADDHPRVRRRFETTRALLHEQGISASLVPIEGQTVLEQTFSTLLVSDWASYGLALARGVDPSPVPMVEELKKRLKE